MLALSDVRAAVVKEIETVLLDDADEISQVTGTEPIHDIGLNSLLLARLIIQLEAAVGVDPFAAGDATLADIRLVNDLVAAYEKGVANAAAASGAVSGADHG